MCGVVGRESGQVRLRVAEHSDGETLERVGGKATVAEAMMSTDEWGGYNGRPAMGRGHATVCHKRGEWAGDDDGAGRHERVRVFGDRGGREARQPRRVAAGIAIVDDDVLALAIAELLEPGRDPLKRLGIATFHSDMQHDDMRHALLRPGKARCA